MKKKMWILPLLICIVMLFASFAMAEVSVVEETNNRGNVTSRTWVDENGKAVAGPNGYAKVTYTYKNRSDLPNVERYFNADGTPFVVPEGYHKVIREYGPGGLVTEESFYDTREKPCLNNEGFASAKYGFTSFGTIRTAYYYDEKGRKVVVPTLGYACLNCEYKGKTLAGEYFLDINKKPMDSVKGYASMVNTLNKSYDVLETAYYHADGSLAVGPDGWSKAVYTNGLNGVHLSAVYYDNKGRLFNNEEGIAEIGFVYGNAGELIGYKLLRNGKEVPGVNGWSSCTYEFDEQDRLISVRYYDINGRLTDRGSGYAYSRKIYHEGNNYDLTWYDVNDRRIAYEGFFSIVYDVDENGRILRSMFLDEEGSSVTNEDGVEAVCFRYDEQGRMTGVRYENANGDPMTGNKGYAGYNDMLDADGFILKREYVDENGNITVDAEGKTGVEFRYDETHILIETTDLHEV